MEDLSYDSLPVILVSAKDNAAASSIISEIIDKECTEDYKEDDLAKRDRVWRIVNKYYTADVRLHPIVDGEESSGEENSAEAHVIYLTEEESASPTAAVSRRAGAGSAPPLVVVVAAGSARPPALRAAAARARAELVCLGAPDDDDDDDYDDDYGVERVREALQAHAWRGRRRTERAGAGAAPPADDIDLFAEALSALPDAARQLRAEPSASRELRLERAEALVAAFCRALGEHPDHW